MKIIMGTLLNLKDFKIILMNFYFDISDMAVASLTWKVGS